MSKSVDHAASVELTTPVDAIWSPIESRRGADSLALTLMLFAAMNAMTMAQISVIAKELQDKFAFSGGNIGLLTSIYMVALGIASIPFGLAAARWGGRVLLAGAAVLAAGSLLFALSSSYPLFCVARFLQGFGGGTTLPVSNALLARSISRRMHSRSMGIFGCGFGAGGVLTLLVLSTVDKAGGYRAMFLASTGIAAAIGLVGLAHRAVRARPAHAEGVPTFRSLMRGVAEVATNGRMLLLMVMNIGIMAIIGGVTAWTPSFLHDQHGATVAVAAYLTAGMAVAELLGNPSGAAFMAKRGKPVVLVSMLGVLLLATALVPAGHATALAFVCVVVAGFSVMAVFAAIMGSVPEVVAHPGQVGAATGFLNLTNLVGTLLAPWLFGVLLDSYGRTTGTHGWGYVWGYLFLALFPLLGLIAAVIYAVMGRKRTRCAAETVVFQTAE